MKKTFISAGILLLLATSCSTNTEPADENKTSGSTPVTITHAKIGPMEETTELNATSVFMLKTPIKASINGYLDEVLVQPGEKVTRGQKLFVIRTKEAANLGNTVNKLDSSFHFKGEVALYSPGNGFITQMNFLTGDYVQEGEQLASFSSAGSLVFLLELPYELVPYLPLNKEVQISLADGHKFIGSLSNAMPTVDAASQTQSYIIHVPANLQLPENLVAKVRFIEKIKNRTVYVPKDAVLTNEVQSKFWVMRMIDSTTAVKQFIKKGMETSDNIEILSPMLSPTDVILLTGNYGLPDTAKVIIENSTSNQ